MRVVCLKNLFKALLKNLTVLVRHLRHAHLFDRLEEVPHVVPGQDDGRAFHLGLLEAHFGLQILVGRLVLIREQRFCRFRLLHGWDNTRVEC